MIENDHRDFGKLQLLGRPKTSMPGEDAGASSVYDPSAKLEAAGVAKLRLSFDHSIDAGDGAQVRVDCLEIKICQALKSRPPHDLEQRSVEGIRNAARGLRSSRWTSWMNSIEILAGPHNLHKIGIREAACRHPSYVRRQVAGVNVQRTVGGWIGAEIPSTSQVSGRIDLFDLMRC